MRGAGAVLDAMVGLRMLVVGDVMLDEYLEADDMGICREGPAPSVHVSGHRRCSGGAANLAANAAALGAQVTLLSAVGDDGDAVLLREALQRDGVDGGHLVVDGSRDTPVKRRIVLGNQLILRVDDGSAATTSAPTAQRLVAWLRELYGSSDCVVVSDYGRGVVSDVVIGALGVLQRLHRGVLVVDSHDPRRFRDVEATAMKPNSDELRPLLGQEPLDGDRAELVATHVAELMDRLGVRVLAASLDVDGAVVCERGGRPYRTWSRPTAQSRACGAGDAYTAALALSLAAGATTMMAAELAQSTALVVTSREGTSVCSRDELRLEVLGGDVVTSVDELARLVQAHRGRGRRIVFTNGCFDLLHRGHVDLLQRAKALGDVLVVGLNSDRSVRALKGADRPLNSLEDRAGVLAALGCIDHLTAFDGDDAGELVDLLQPDVYVKGGDYTPAMLPESAHVERYGGEVRILPYVENRSTTSLIERIRA